MARRRRRYLSPEAEATAARVVLLRGAARAVRSVADPDGWAPVRAVLAAVRWPRSSWDGGLLYTRRRRRRACFMPGTAERLEAEADRLAGQLVGEPREGGRKVGAVGALELRAMLRRLGLSRVRADVALGVGGGTVHRWASGMTPPPAWAVAHLRWLAGGVEAADDDER